MLLGVRRPRLPFDVMQDFPNDFYDTQWVSCGKYLFDN